MEPVERAGPGIEEHADEADDAACRLADIAVPGGWSETAVDDTLVAIDTLAAALAQLDREVAEVLAATATARRHLGLPVDAEAETAPSTTTPAVPGPRTGRQPRRRGLGPGFQGIR
ncbi:hypothetical protein [Streptomyces sp. NPDC018711]|uniref:hypothetical protein n=1 Tax=Streptomyces sp. NPDC018711 TaxID=3365052 RepID=UPI003794BFF6